MGKEGFSKLETKILLIAGLTTVLLFMGFANLITSYSAFTSGKLFAKRTTNPAAQSKFMRYGRICTSVDVVYLWVNGSDPAQQKAMHEHGIYWDGGYRDYGVIKYSARSVAEFMPWVRNIIIVTNGQVPDWVDLKSPRLRIVTHDTVCCTVKPLPFIQSVFMHVLSFFFWHEMSRFTDL